MAFTTDWEVLISFDDGSTWTDLADYSGVCLVEDSITRTMRLYNDLTPASSTCSFTIENPKALNDVLLAFTGQALVDIRRDSVAYFYGIVRDNYRFAYNGDLDRMTFEAEDNSWKLRRTHGWDSTDDLVISALPVSHPTNDCAVRQILTAAGYAAGEIGTLPDVSQTVTLTVQSSAEIIQPGNDGVINVIYADKLYQRIARTNVQPINYQSVLTQLLFEFGYVYYFDSSGDCQIYKWAQATVPATTGDLTAYAQDMQVQINDASKINRLDIRYNVIETSTERATIFSRDRAGGLAFSVGGGGVISFAIDGVTNTSVGTTSGNFAAEPLSFSDQIWEIRYQYVNNNQTIIERGTSGALGEIYRQVGGELVATGESGVWTVTFTVNPGSVEISATTGATGYPTVYPAPLSIRIMTQYTYSIQVGTESKIAPWTAGRPQKIDSLYLQSAAQAQTLADALLTYQGTSNRKLTGNVLLDGGTILPGEYYDLDYTNPFTGDRMLDSQVRIVSVTESEQNPYSARIEAQVVSAFVSTTGNSLAVVQSDRIVPASPETSATLFLKPSYEDVVSGTSKDGGIAVPATPTLALTAHGRTVAIVAGRQDNFLAGSIRHEVQIRYPASSADWYALGPGGTGTNDWRSGSIGDTTEFAGYEYTHQKLPLSGTALEPTDRVYEYRIRAKSDAGTSDWSTEVAVTASPYDITDLNVKNLFAQTITVNSTGYIASSNYVAGTSGFKISADGTAEFRQGTIGAWTINATELSAGATTSYMALKPGTGIWLGNETFASAPFSVTNAGVLKATSGTIGGWSLNTFSLSSNNITINANGFFTIGTGSDIVYLSSADATYRIWVGSAIASSAPFSVTKAGAIKSTSGTIGGWTIASTSLSATSSGNSAIISPVSGLQLGTTGSPQFTVSLAGALTATSATISGTITATSGAIGGWTIATGTLKSGASGTARIELEQALRRISIINSSDATKVAMGYLEGLTPNDGGAPFDSSVYGFWAAAGDQLRIDGDAEYTSGDWLLAADASFKIVDGVTPSIVRARLGTITGEIGLYINEANTGSDYRLKATDATFFVGNDTKYLSFDAVTETLSLALTNFFVTTLQTNTLGVVAVSNKTGLSVTDPLFIDNSATVTTDAAGLIGYFGAPSSLHLQTGSTDRVIVTSSGVFNPLYRVDIGTVGASGDYGLLISPDTSGQSIFSIKNSGDTFRIRTGAWVSASDVLTITSTGALSASATITAGTGLTVTTGGANITGTTAVTGAITATTSISATTSITAGTGLTVTTGDLGVTAGSITAGTTVTAGTGLTVFSGGATINGTTNTNGALLVNTSGRNALTVGTTTAGDIECGIRVRATTAGFATRSADIYIDANNYLLKISAPSNATPTIDAITVSATGAASFVSTITAGTGLTVTTGGATIVGNVLLGSGSATKQLDVVSSADANIGVRTTLNTTFASVRVGDGGSGATAAGTALHHMGSAYTPSGAYYADGGTLAGFGAGGLNLLANSGGVRIFTGSGAGTLAFTIDTSQNASFVGSVSIGGVSLYGNVFTTSNTQNDVFDWVNAALGNPTAVFKTACMGQYNGTNINLVRKNSSTQIEFLTGAEAGVVTVNDGTGTNLAAGLRIFLIP